MVPPQVLVLYLCVLKVVSPKWSDFVLTTNIPNCETDVLVFDCLNIEPWKANMFFFISLKRLLNILKKKKQI